VTPAYALAPATLTRFWPAIGDGSRVIKVRKGPQPEANEPHWGTRLISNRSMGATGKSIDSVTSHAADVVERHQP